MRKMNVIRSHLHNVYTEEVNKAALSAEDDERVFMENGLHTLAYGHNSLKNLSTKMWFVSVTLFCGSNVVKCVFLSFVMR